MPNPTPKGERKPFYVRVPVDHAAVYKREAKRRGMDHNTYLTWALAEFHGLNRHQQKEPPVSDAA